ncbi:MAG: hypothetical protein ACYDER_08985 [Ktedonobacteraceae bacterium]
MILLTGTLLAQGRRRSQRLCVPVATTRRPTGASFIRYSTERDGLL